MVNFDKASYSNMQFQGYSAQIPVGVLRSWNGYPVYDDYDVLFIHRIGLGPWRKQSMDPGLSDVSGYLNITVNFEKIENVLNRPLSLRMQIAQLAIPREFFLYVKVQTYKHDKMIWILVWFELSK